jgi:hypothetical protein
MYADHDRALRLVMQVQSDEVVPAAPASNRSTQLRRVAAAVTLRAEAYLRTVHSFMYACNKFVELCQQLCTHTYKQCEPNAVRCRSVEHKLHTFVLPALELKCRAQAC